MDFSRLAEKQNWSWGKPITAASHVKSGPELVSVNE